MNPRTLENRRRFRFLLSFSFLSFLVIAAAILLPTQSRARLQVPQEPSRREGKRMRPAYVPGQALVRYRNEASAKAETLSAKALQVNGRSLPVRIERFGGSDMVEGLRLARVPETDT